MKEMISIIIPIYNAEKNLRVCLDSIMHQTYNNFEVILINDGSTDSSSQIIKEYLKKDNRFKCFNQKNSGVAIARNNGIKYAKSKFLMFMDNDDKIDNNYLESMLNEMDEKTDIVIDGYKRETYDGKILFERKMENSPICKYIQNACWGKLYRKDIITKSKACFLNSPIADDFYFDAILYNSTAKIKYVNLLGYHWLFNNESLSNTSNKGLKYTEDLINVFESITKDISNKNDELEFFYLRSFMYYILFSCKKVSKNIIYASYDRLFNYLKDVYPNYQRNKYIGIFKKGDNFKVRIIIVLFIFLQRLNLIKPFIYLYSRI